MMRRTPLIALLTSFALTGPASAATGPFFSLHNTNFVVLLGFLVFVAIIVYFGIPGRLTAMLDDRATGIRGDLDEARELREEAQELLASYERKTRDARTQAEEIVASAKSQASEAAEQAKKDLEVSVERRITAAEERIESAQRSAVREVRDRAVQVAIAAAGEVIAGQMDAAEANKLIDQSIETVSTKLH